MTNSSPEPQFILHAPNVHIGGGFTLLKSLLTEDITRSWICQLDARNQSKSLPKNDKNIYWVKLSIGSRLLAEYRLKKICKAKDTVLCFHNLPPLFKLAGKVLVFNQNRLLHDTIPMAYAFRTRLRLRLERSWFKLCQNHVDIFLVQTPSMAEQIAKTLASTAKIQQSSFLPSLKNLTNSSSNLDKIYDYIYPANGDSHKNHLTLLKAWCLLANEGHYPSLVLSIDPKIYPQLAMEISNCQQQNIKIVNLAWVNQIHLLTAYKQSKALIYPSVCESFGSPLIEARELGLSIVAAECDYVRDLIDPAESFDPNSACSIMRAIMRHQKIKQARSKILSSAEFVREFLPGQSESSSSLE